VKIATWNVNGIRAREAQLQEWLERERPDVVCLQEVKASPSQVPSLIFEMQGYWCCWHCAGAYSGVALHIRRELSADRPQFAHPPFDRETRIVTARVADLIVASIYVPNGGKDFQAKLDFLEGMERWVSESHASGAQLVLCGDLNVTRSEQDVHPKERKPGAIGQRPDERAAFERVLNAGGAGLIDLGRELAPDDDQLFTWWAPWRNLRQRNIGWRIDYVLASSALSSRVQSCRVQPEVGTSDHAPVVAVFE
jgi:exodeoxyribonuclease-3